MKESHFVSEHKTFAWCKESTFALVKLIRNNEGQYFQKTTRRFSKYYFRHWGKQFLPFFLKNLMKAWGNLPFSLRRENAKNAVANATRVHPWDVKNKTGSRVQTIPRDIPSSTDVPVLLLNHSNLRRQFVIKIELFHRFKLNFKLSLRIKYMCIYLLYIYGT